MDFITHHFMLAFHGNNSKVSDQEFKISEPISYHSSHFPYQSSTESSNESSSESSESERELTHLKPIETSNVNSNDNACAFEINCNNLNSHPAEDSSLSNMQSTEPSNSLSKSVDLEQPQSSGLQDLDDESEDESEFHEAESFDDNHILGMESSGTLTGDAATSEVKMKAKRRRRRGKKKSVRAREAAAREALLLAEASQDGNSLPTSTINNEEKKSEIASTNSIDNISKSKSPLSSPVKKQEPISSTSTSPLKKQPTINKKKENIINNKKKEANTRPYSASDSQTGKSEPTHTPFRRFSHSALKTNHSDEALNSSTSSSSNSIASTSSIRPIRQPIGPALSGNGFSEEYQKSRIAARRRFENQQRKITIDTSNTITNEKMESKLEMRETSAVSPLLSI